MVTIVHFLFSWLPLSTFCLYGYHCPLSVAARKSPHRFPTVAEESEALIDNFKPVYFTDGSFSEVYFFNFTDPVLRAKRLAM